ncbi:two-component sensor histidine kinase [Lactococcus insecticola]|uniref:histidine kinase n=1 Tax=Pseudolactococcus insecticola TaxID=2709158 RepID=A0A6A0B5K1_9LACT|nr:two-component sensor histidine kinase [Lactococcus insecticola]
MIFTGLYFLATLVVVILLNSHTTTIDTNNLTSRAYAISDSFQKNTATQFDDSIKILPKNDTSTAVKNIKKGANLTRTMTSKTLTITIPSYHKAVLTNFIQVTGERSSSLFENVVMVIFALAVYIIWAFQLYTRDRDRHRFELDTIAKIKNIRRSPLTQSYLISENDNQITTELNHLGETIQHQAESQTPAKKNLYEFIEFFEFPIFIYDIKGAIRRSNASFKNEFSDTKNLDIFSPYSDVLQFLVNKMLKPTRQEQTFYFELINAYYTIDVQPLHTLEDRIMVTMIDVTAYKATMRAHNDFIANISHDLKTPLAAIAGFADILATDQDLPAEKSQDFADHIVSETKRLSSLVTDTLEMTRQTGKIKKTELNLTQLTQDVLSNFDLTIAKKSQVLTTDLAENLIIKSNDKHLYAVLKNLVENAVNYTPEQGKIFVSLMMLDDHATFSVTDNGPGLSEVEKTRIFERFYRSDKTRDSDGTGLGLAIVKKNLKELGGKIDVVSILGKGTTFTVTL